MITLPEYTVMGEDGQEYGPVSAQQIRQWVADGRLEKKTPVKPAEMRDWIFLGLLPEFADLFAPPPPPPPKVLPRKELVVTVVVVALLTLAYFLFKHFNHH